jgi:hypothetical protein
MGEELLFGIKTVYSMILVSPYHPLLKVQNIGLHKND